MTVADTEKKKRGGGRDKRSLFKAMRARAWVADLIRRTGETTNGLRQAVIPPDSTLDARFDKYWAGKSTPSQQVLNQRRGTSNFSHYE